MILLKLILAIAIILIPPKPQIIAPISPSIHLSRVTYEKAKNDETEGLIWQNPVIPNSTAQNRQSIYCSCVRTAHFLNPKVPMINAADFKPNITRFDVRVGDVVLEKYPDTDHIALIADIQKEGYIVNEGNYRECEFSEGRAIPYNSERIRGFYRP